MRHQKEEKILVRTRTLCVMSRGIIDDLFAPSQLFCSILDFCVPVIHFTSLLSFFFHPSMMHACMN